MRLDFGHRQSAHCESGVAANLLTHGGLELSEATAFGLGQGLFFGYFPFVRINQLPLITYRSAAGSLLRVLLQRIHGLSMEEQRFTTPTEAMAALDALLGQSIPVALQTGVFWLPYFPPALRFHFNAHTLVVYGREGHDYLISDPVFPAPVRCAADDLARARFASGPLAPKGRMYFLRRVPAAFDRKQALQASIDKVCARMLAPFPLIGVRGIEFLARRLAQWPKRLGEQKALLHLGHVVRMQEEIGTGGAGFRYMYAAFLQENAAIINAEILGSSATALTKAGDCWRFFAVMAARMCKGRGQRDDSFPALAAALHSCAQQEKNVYLALRAWSRSA